MIKQSDLKLRLKNGERKRITDSFGLTLLIRGNQDTTSYTFISRVSLNGKRIEKNLPTTDLKKARELALQRYNNAKNGIHPDIDTSAPTFERALDEFLDFKKDKLRTQTFGVYARYKESFKPIFNIAVDKIKARYIYDNVLVHYADRAPTQHYLFMYFQGVMHYAQAKYSELDINDCNSIKMLLARYNAKHIHSMTDGNIGDNIRYIFSTFANEPMRNKTLLELSFYLLLRPNEIANIKLEHIDIENSILYVPRTKTIDESIGFKVPLSKQAKIVIAKVISDKKTNNEYLFDSSCRARKLEHIQANRLSLIMARLGLDKDITAHGIRAMGRTWFEQQGIKFEVAETCLSHKVGDNTINAYRRTDYLEERKEVMQTWSDYVQESIKEYSLA